MEGFLKKKKKKKLHPELKDQKELRREKYL